ncbi:ABC transporter substrate-binding protein [Acidaminobacter sp. JC074]|uniref:ABC transporter substrate-binding protein n=1 Tax=Acidaminobacter sp. JC074 TaxID=2530199 RepID=UPI001F0D24CB|nr:MqnA/MqnD/SBP family protein [Acidaminobacter sp. JC074]MCH4886054.1 ABC transporter substrate-binding protein [Acidaminobacter sp. JC074]
MKKSLALIGIMLLALMVFVGCQANEANNVVENEVVENSNDQVEATEEATEEVEEATEVEEPVEKPVLKIATLKGPTGMGMVQLMENDEMMISEIDYEFDIVGAPDQIIGQIVQGNVDIAAVPSNMGAILDVKTEGKIQVLAVNTLGVLYIVENGDTVNSLEDLKGKTVLGSGKGASPEYIINYLLAENGLTEDVTVEYAVEHSEVAAKVTTGDAPIVLLPQPFVTSVTLGSETNRIAVDLTAEWEKATDGLMLPMGAIVVNKAYAEENPQVIEKFMEEYKASVDFVNANPADAGVLVEKFGIIPKAALATKAIPNCNITLIPAQEAKESLQAFYEILHGFNPKAVGGKLPEDAFYYEKK